jgi:hypothetical protein
MSNQVPVQIGFLNWREFADLGCADGDKYEMNPMAVSGPQLILAERQDMDEVNS